MVDPNLLNIEIDDKRRIAVADFELLVSPGVIGFYRGCEITQIFLFDEQETVANVFTVACFSELEKPTSHRFLTDPPPSISDTYKLGIVQHHVDLDAAAKMFAGLLENRFVIHEKEANVSPSLVLLPKQYVPQLWGGSNPPLMSSMKPSFRGENYVVEFFDEKKEQFEGLSRKQIDDIFERVSAREDIQINLSKVYERLGGVLFQFPINLLTCNCTLTETRNHLSVELMRHPNLATEQSLQIHVKTSLDSCVTGYWGQDITSNDTEFSVEVGDSNSLELTLAKPNSSIIYYHSKMHFMRSSNILGQIAMGDAEPRIFQPSDQQEVVEIAVTTPMPMSVGMRHDSEYLDQIYQRERDHKALANSGDYGVFRDDRKGALDFLRSKLNGATRLSEVCLWDPYLTVQDIVDVLYFQSSQIPFRCVASYDGLKNTVAEKLAELGKEQADFSTRFELIRSEQGKLLGSITNNLGVNLDFRCSHQHFGYGFHDRFLLLVPTNEKYPPEVYSLGTSVNSLGNDHHIIQKVANPWVILNNFNELWDSLPPENCRLIQLPSTTGGS